MARKKKAIDRVEFVVMEKQVDVMKLAKKLLKGVPLIVNYEDYNEIEANKVITFLSGVIYALDGEIEVIQPTIFLFATKTDYKDGTLRKFVEDYKE